MLAGAMGNKDLRAQAMVRELCLALCTGAAYAGNGYALSFEGTTQGMSLAAGALDMTNTHTAAMANGFTVMAWLKYRDVSPTGPCVEWSMTLASDANFMNGFGGGGSTCTLASLRATHRSTRHSPSVQPTEHGSRRVSPAQTCSPAASSGSARAHRLASTTPSGTITP